MSKRTLKNRFFSKRLKIKQNTAKIGVNFVQSEKTSVQVSAVPKLTVSLKRSPKQTGFL